MDWEEHQNARIRRLASGFIRANEVAIKHRSVMLALACAGIK